MTISGPIFCSPTPDEERLVRLFRLISNPAKRDLLTELATQVAEELTRPNDGATESEDERSDRIKIFLKETVSAVQPYDDFICTLSGYDDLDNAFSDGTVAMVTGDSRQDSEIVSALMDSYSVLQRDHPDLIRTSQFWSGDSDEESDQNLRDALMSVLREWRYRFLENLEEFESKRRGGGGWKRDKSN